MLLMYDPVACRPFLVDDRRLLEETLMMSSFLKEPRAVTLELQKKELLEAYEKYRRRVEKEFKQKEEL